MKSLTAKSLVRWFLGLAGGWSVFALGSIQNPNLLPLGENELFMANAGVAGNGGSGSVYYNPAGLAFQQGDRLSFSGTSYVASQLSAGAFAHFDNTDLSYHASGFQTVPNTVVSSIKVGDWQLAVSVLVPESYSVNNQLSIPTPNTTTTLVQSQSDSDLWIGLSASRKLSEAWAVGVSIFAIEHQETSQLGVFITTPAAPNLAAINEIETQLSVWGFSATAGVLWSATEFLDLGFRLQSPLLAFSGSASGYNFQQSVSGGTPSVTQNSQSNIQGSYPLPLDMSLGSQWYLGKNVNLFFDVSLQLGTSYDPYPNSTFSSPTSTQTTPRFNFGASAKLSDSFALEAGMLYNLGTEKVTAQSSAGTASENYLGATAGLLFTSGRVKTGIGGFYLWSSGQVVQAGTTGVLTGFNAQRLGAILSFAYSL